MEDRNDLPSPAGAELTLTPNFEEGGSSKGEEGCEGSWSGGERWWRRHCLRRRFLAIRRVGARSKSNSTATRAEKYFNSLLAVLRSFGRRTGRADYVKSNNNSQQPARWRRRRGGQATPPPRGHRMQRRRRRGQQSWFNRLPAAAAPPPSAPLHPKVNDRFCVQRECRKKNTRSKDVSAAAAPLLPQHAQSFKVFLHIHLACRKCGMETGRLCC